MDGSPLTLKFENGRRGGDPRTGTFHQMRVTAGDTACSVKGVSECLKLACKIKTTTVKMRFNLM